MSEINQSQYEKELDYLYGKYSGKSALDKKIEKAESILNSRQEAIEKAKERIIKKERVKNLIDKPLKDLSFQDIEQMKEDGIVPDGFSHPAGYVPDVSGLYSKLLDTLKDILEIRGYQVSLKPMKSLTDVRDNIFAIRDAMKQQNEPENLDGLDIPVGETVDFEKWDNAYQDVKKTEFVIDYNVPDIASKGDTMIIKSDGTWERKPRYSKEELIHTKHEIESMLRSYT